MPFLPEPPPRAKGPDTAVLLVNLGSPAAPTAAALRPYLAQFLSDRRVIELPRLLWWPLLHGIILNTRPRRSAAKYASVWSPAGSPLQASTRQQAELLAQKLADAGHHLTVAWAMRYGQPSIGASLSQLKADGVRRILLVPLYPQYAASTTATVVDEAARWLLQTRNQPEFRFLRSFPTDNGYIEALAGKIETYWQVHGRPEHFLLSFHGMPEAMRDAGDPYADECRQTAQALATRLGLNEAQWTLSFQSRFGPAAWLQPYTDVTLRQLAGQGCQRVDVACPGFVSDCLETLEEIGIEGKQEFLAHGGGEYHYIPCLNAEPVWIAALEKLILQNITGW